MGRIKTALIKRVTHDLVHTHPELISADFAKNKTFVAQHTTVGSRKMRNVIAGYVSRLAKAKAR
jgi:small subunit ribosomal protein S17e